MAKKAVNADRPCPHCGGETNCNLDNDKIVRHEDGTITIACPQCNDLIHLDDTRRKVLPPFKEKE